jgi:hypothetical protein
VKLGLEPRDVSQDFATLGLGATGRRPPGFRGRAGALAGLGLALCLSLGTGCGYRPVYGSSAGVRYAVTTGRYGTASFEAVQAAVSGVRSELGAAEALGGTFPQVIVEVLRVDERSIGVRSTSNDMPLARGSEIVVVGRATIVAAPEAAPSFDTGDISRSAQFAAGVSPTADAAARSRAVRDAARSVGKALGRAILGLPEPSEG